MRCYSLARRVVRLAFVGYRDFGRNDESSQACVLDFTHDLAEFKKFVNGLSTGYNPDYAEDVYTGLEALTKLSWVKPGAWWLLCFTKELSWAIPGGGCSACYRAG